MERKRSKLNNKEKKSGYQLYKIYDVQKPYVKFLEYGTGQHAGTENSAYVSLMGCTYFSSNLDFVN